MMLSAVMRIDSLVFSVGSVVFPASFFYSGYDGLLFAGLGAWL